jgi:hypothetical protein
MNITQMIKLLFIIRILQLMAALLTNIYLRFSIQFIIMIIIKSIKTKIKLKCENRNIKNINGIKINCML